MDLTGEPPLSAAICVERGGPRLFLNGEETYPFAALSRQLHRTLPNFAAAGVPLIQPVLGLRSGWNGPEEYDWDGLVAHLYDVLEAYPEARLLPRLLLNTPTWWKEANPEEIIEYGLDYDEDDYDVVRSRSLEPTRGGHYFGTAWELWEASFASERWRADTAAMLRAFTEHIEGTPLDSRVVGYHVCTGTTAEWHNFGPYNLPGYGTPMRRRCGDVPDPDARMNTDHGLLRDPATERDVIDFYECYHAVTAESIATMAEAVKSGSDDRALVGTFYNYLIENVWIQEAGHLAPRPILEDPRIDFLASPYAYQRSNAPDTPEWGSDVVDGVGNWLGRARGVGGDGGYRIPVESARRHDKLFVVEIDPSTHQAPEIRHVGGRGSDTVAGTKRILRRDLGKMFVTGNGGWLYDFGPDQGADSGWYAGDSIIETIDEFVTLGGRRPDLDIGSVAEVAAVYSAESFFATQHWTERGGTDFFNHWFLDSQTRSLHRIGAPVDLLYDFDLTEADARRYDVLFMANAFAMDAEAIERIRDLLRDSGTTVVWWYAPGYVGPERLSLEGMERLTSLRFSELTEPGPMLIRLEDSMQRRTGIDRFGVEAEHWPRFAVTDPDATRLGTWTDRPDATAMAHTAVDGWHSIYTGTGPLPAEVLRWIVADSPARLWSTRPDVLSASEDAVMVTATAPGDRRVEFHKPLTRRGSSTEDTAADLELAFGDNAIFLSDRRG